MSAYPGETADKGLFTRLTKEVEDYIIHQYPFYLKRAGHLCIYDIDIRDPSGGDNVQDPESNSDDGPIEGCYCPDDASCGHDTIFRWVIMEKRRFTHTTTHRYDQVFSVTQGAINLHFKTLWDLAKQKVKSHNSYVCISEEQEIETCLAEYSLTHHDYGEEVFFEARFDTPEIQLICNDDNSKSVVFYLCFRHGSVKIGKQLMPT